MKNKKKKKGKQTPVVETTTTFTVSSFDSYIILPAAVQETYREGARTHAHTHV